jgi:hypothetical protein
VRTAVKYVVMCALTLHYYRIVWVIILRRMRWARHVAYKGDFFVLVEKHVEKRQFERARDGSLAANIIACRNNA